jgi:hypothetical protein
MIRATVLGYLLLVPTCHDDAPAPAPASDGNISTCANPTTVSGDPQLTECAIDLIGYTNGIVEAVNAIAVPLETRTLADVLSCPAETGVGEQSHVNIFSYVGPLDKTCNRGGPVALDDCADPARSNYWISVVDDRRVNTDPYTFRVIWGNEDLVQGTGVPVDYYHYGSCSPDPNGFDNQAAGIPKLLTPVHDVDGNGSVDSCPYQNHVYLFKFYTVDENGKKAYLEKGNIAKISSPFLAPSGLPLPGVNDADRAATDKSAYVALNITLKHSEGEVVTAFVENNAEVGGSTTWIQWKQPAP